LRSGPDQRILPPQQQAFHRQGELDLAIISVTINRRVRVDATGASRSETGAPLMCAVVPFPYGLKPAPSPSVSSNLLPRFDDSDG
jgi:hypothetical protein